MTTITTSATILLQNDLQKFFLFHFLCEFWNFLYLQMRHLFVIVDTSDSMKEGDLLRPSRLASTQKVLNELIIKNLNSFLDGNLF